MNTRNNLLYMLFGYVLEMTNPSDKAVDGSPALSEVGPLDPGATQIMQAWVKEVKMKRALGADIGPLWRAASHAFRVPSAWRLRRP